MKISISNQKFLIFIMGYSAIAAGVFFLIPGIAATLFLFPFFLFFPGHALLSLVYPRAGGPGKLARFSIGIGLSIATITLVGMAMATSPWGLTPSALTTATLMFIVSCAIAAFFKGRKIAPTHRLCLNIPALVGPGNMFSNSHLERILSLIFITAIIIVAASLIFSLASPPPGEAYTEFFAIPYSDSQKPFPVSAIVGQPTGITLAIVNHEKRNETYSIETYLNKIKINRQDTSELKPLERIDIPLSLTIDSAGKDQRLEFYLYRSGETTPLIRDPLSIVIDASSSTK